MKKSIAGLINDSISDRLKTALQTETEKEKEQIQSEETESPKSDIVTTEEELEGFMIVKAILREVIDVERVQYRDAKSYFAILFDDNNRKPICRLYFNSPTVKYIVSFDESKNETRHDIESLDDIYLYKKEIQEAAKNYL